MKRILLIISVAALLFGMLQCRKPVFPDFGGGDYKEITFVTEGGNSKGELVPNTSLEQIKYQWDDNDKIYVYASDNSSNFDDGNRQYCGCLKDISIGPGLYTAKFTGQIKEPYKTGKVRFIHYGSDVTVDDETGVASVSFAEQNGVLNSSNDGDKDASYTISSKMVAMCEMPYQQSGSYTPKEGENLKIQFAIANFSFSNFTGTNVISRGFDCNGIEVTAEGKINYTEGSSSILRNAAVTKGPYYTVFMPESSPVIHSFLGDEEEARMELKTFTLGMFYYGSSFSDPLVIPGTKTMPDDVIGGKFTVDASGTQVYFAKGNVQYNAVQTNKWRFAPHQYDYIGSDNSKISSTYDGWIDLFGWATSGRELADHSFTHSQPYITSTSNGDYKAYNSMRKSLTDEDGSADWGKNFGDGLWFTLSKAQYEYIVGKNTGTKRTVSFVCVEDGKPKVYNDFLYSRIYVGSKMGLIIFPDSFQWTTDMGSLPNKNSLVAKNYTIEQFEKMERAGAVFLPTCGYRNGTTVNATDNICDYWTSSFDGDKAYLFQVNIDVCVTSENVVGRHFGMSVRLVRNTSANFSNDTAEDLVVTPW